jgi:hypothetical protein
MKDVPDAARMRCLLASLTTPGDDVEMRLRHAVLRFAAERGWVLIGGWAQELALRGAGAVGRYDERFACRMSDVDAMCADPVGDLVELATRLHREVGVKASVGVGMTPNVYHLHAEGVPAALIDLLGVTREMLAALPTSGPHPLVLAPGEPALQFRASRLATELARQYILADNVLNSYHATDARYDRLAARIRAIEAVTPVALSSRPIRSAASAASRRPPAGVFPALAASALSTVDLLGRFAVVDEFPGDILVCATDAVAVIQALVSAASPTSLLALYAPLDIGPFYVMVAEACGATVFVITEPVPCAPSPSRLFPASYAVSARTAASHLRASDVWRRLVGDAAGAAARGDAFAAALSELLRLDTGADPPASEYAGTLPFEPIYSRYLRSRNDGGKPPIRYATPPSGAAPVDPSAVAGLVRGGTPDSRDGRRIEATPCGGLVVGGPLALAAALARAAPRNLTSRDIHRGLPTTPSHQRLDRARHGHGGKHPRR